MKIALERGVIDQRIALLEGDHVMLDNPFTRAELLSAYKMALKGLLVEQALKGADDAMPLVIPDASKPGRKECIRDYQKLVKRIGHHPTRRVFLQLSATGRRYEKLWRNYGGFVRDAKKVWPLL